MSDLEQYWDEPETTGESVEFEFSFDVRSSKPPVSVKRLFGLTFLSEEEEEEEEEEAGEDEEYVPTEEERKRILVLGTIERAISAIVWTHRQLNDEKPRMVSYLVTRTFIEEVEDVEYDDWWVMVELTERNGLQPPFQIPLHQFLAQCEPLGELTFKDFHA